MKPVARILTIAGSDSGGGAGIQADIKTITMLGGHAMTAITAVTAQNTLAVTQVELLSPAMVLAQIDAVLSDIGVDAVKIGMLGSPANANAVADRLKDLSVPIVFDPVMVATSGAALADAATIAAFDRLLALSSVATPNKAELSALGGRDAVLAHGCHLIEKGGHDDGPVVEDRLWSPQAMIARLEGKRFDTADTHGTGCTLASALACRLGQGYGVVEAFQDAVRYVRLALLAAPGLGQGHGPLGRSRDDDWDDDDWD